jgi:hypothetical protein
MVVAVFATEGADTLAVTAVAEPDSHLIVVYHFVCDILWISKVCIIRKHTFSLISTARSN